MYHIFSYQHPTYFSNVISNFNRFQWKCRYWFHVYFGNILHKQCLVWMGLEWFKWSLTRCLLRCDVVPQITSNLTGFIGINKCWCFIFFAIKICVKAVGCTSVSCTHHFHSKYICISESCTSINFLGMVGQVTPSVSKTSYTNTHSNIFAVFSRVIFARLVKKAQKCYVMYINYWLT